MNKDTLLVGLGDFHSGSSVSLFPNGFRQFKNGNHTPTPLQKKIREVWGKGITHVKGKRKNNRLILVHNGDSVEGVHHGTKQILTYIKDEQIEIHTELMDEFMGAVKFNKKSGDKLYYTSGTESHTNDKEDTIGKDLRAEKDDDGRHVFDRLELNINGRDVIFSHHGPKRGDGPNVGNAMRNALRNIYYESLERGVKPPDLVAWSHTHVPHYQSYVGTNRTIHGIILPSFQAMTRFAYKVAGLATVEVGMCSVFIRADGHIEIPPTFIKGQVEQTTKVFV